VTTTIKASSVVEQYLEVIPGAAGMAEKYLQAIVAAVRAQQLDVTLGTTKAASGFFRQLSGAHREFVVIVPRNENLDEFTFYHFAAPTGVNLAIGWYLTRDPKGFSVKQAAGMATAAFTRSSAIGIQVAEMMLRLDLFDQADLQALMQCVHSFVVVEAMYQIADAVGYPRDRLGARSKGFFGLGAS
jgi:hypothetical protein